MRDGGRGGKDTEREQLYACMCVCVCRGGDELHDHFLRAFKPSQKSLLFDPLSSLSSFSNIILKYLANKSSYVIPPPATLKLSYGNTEY